MSFLLRLMPILVVISLLSPQAFAHSGSHGSESFLGHLAHFISSPDHGLLTVALGLVLVSIAKRSLTKRIRAKRA